MKIICGEFGNTACQFDASSEDCLDVFDMIVIHYSRVSHDSIIAVSAVENLFFSYRNIIANAINHSALILTAS